MEYFDPIKLLNRWGRILRYLYLITLTLIINIGCITSLPQETISTPYAPNPPSEDSVVVAASSLYAYIAPSDRFAIADIVVTGRVQEISSTKYNSDDGSIWNGGSGTLLPIHTISIAIKEILKSKDHIKDNQLTITAIGQSPNDPYNVHPDHSIQTSDFIVAYLNVGFLTWKDNEVRNVIQFINSPESSYKLQLNDGLFYAQHDNEEEAPQTLTQIRNEASEQQRLAFNDLANTNWEILTFVSTDGKNIHLSGDEQIAIQFQSITFNIIGACSDIVAEYQVSDGMISISELERSKHSCQLSEQSQLYQAEEIISTMLHQAQSYKLLGKRLTIRFNNGEMTFRQPNEY